MVRIAKKKGGEIRLKNRLPLLAIIILVLVSLTGFLLIRTPKKQPLQKEEKQVKDLIQKNLEQDIHPENWKAELNNENWAIFNLGGDYNHYWNWWTENAGFGKNLYAGSTIAYKKGIGSRAGSVIQIFISEPGFTGTTLLKKMFKKFPQENLLHSGPSSYGDSYKEAWSVFYKEGEAKVLVKLVMHDYSESEPEKWSRFNEKVHKMAQVRRVVYLPEHQFYDRVESSREGFHFIYENHQNENSSTMY